MGLRELSVARQLFLLQLAVILLTAVVGSVLVYRQAEQTSENDASRNVLAAASLVAQLPQVRETLTRPPLTGNAILQPIADAIQVASPEVDESVVIIDSQYTRLTSPTPSGVGIRYDGDLTAELSGQTVLDRWEENPSEPRMRARVPVYGTQGQVVGVVEVSSHSQIAQAFSRLLPGLLGVFGSALAAVALGSFFVSQRLKRQTHGLGPEEITAMYEHHDAVLHAMREGLVVVDPTGRMILANDEARRLLLFGADFHGQRVHDLKIPGSLRELLESGRTVTDEIHLTRDHTLLVNQMPVYRKGRLLGTATTLRDHTELQALTGELDSIRGFADALRAQAHESANRLHTVVMLVELGKAEEAVTLATAELQAAQQLADQLVGAVQEPALAALMLGKLAVAHEKGVELFITPDTVVDAVSIETRDLVTLVGNLVDNALEAAVAGPAPRRVDFTARQDGDTLVIRVADSGSGLDPERAQQAFTRGWSTKTPDRLHGRGLGLALVGQVVHRYSGTIDVSNEGGAVFTVRLPHVVASGTPAPSEFA